ncbi:hypothetical protein ACIBCT_38450 [Streptosporangium sp. NPDC050855]
MNGRALMASIAERLCPSGAVTLPRAEATTPVFLPLDTVTAYVSQV